MTSVRGIARAVRGIARAVDAAIGMSLLVVTVPGCAARPSATGSASAAPDPPPEFHAHPDVAPEDISTQGEVDSRPATDAGIHVAAARTLACNHLSAPPPAPISRRRIHSGPPITNRIPPEIVMRPIATRAACLRACYQRALTAKPNLQGRVALRLVIDEDGWLRRASVWQNDAGDSELAECLAHELVGLQFPQPEGGKVTVIYPLVLAPEWVDAGGPNAPVNANPK